MNYERDDKKSRDGNDHYISTILIQSDPGENIKSNRIRDSPMDEHSDISMSLLDEVDKLKIRESITLPDKIAQLGIVKGRRSNTLSTEYTLRDKNNKMNNLKGIYKIFLSSGDKLITHRNKKLYDYKDRKEFEGISKENSFSNVGLNLDLNSQEDVNEENMAVKESNEIINLNFKSENFEINKSSSVNLPGNISSNGNSNRLLSLSPTHNPNSFLIRTNSGTSNKKVEISFKNEKFGSSNNLFTNESYVRNLIKIKKFNHCTLKLDFIMFS